MLKKLLELHSISKMYPKSDKYANQDINLVFFPGQITGLTGHNGAGKTTLLNQLIGITKPTKGSITYNHISFVTNTKAARRYVSMMPQLHAPLVGVTVAQSIESILRIKGVDYQNIKKKCSKIMEALNIEEWRDVCCDNLSGGIKRLTSFAMAVAEPSEIIILDEPTNDVDPIRRELIWRYLKKLAKKGHIIIVVTHNLLEVEKYADRYLIMTHGKIHEDSSFKDELNVNENRHYFEVYFNKLIDLNQANFPFSSITQVDRNKLLLRMELQNETIPSALNWALQLIEKNQITHYNLSNEKRDSLNEIYIKKEG